jgi:hypothetical protein
MISTGGKPMFKQRSITYWLLASTIIVASMLAADAFGEEASDVQKVTIDVLAKKPGKFVGKQLRIEGVVARVVTDDQIFLIAEKSACGGCPAKKTCGVSELAIFYEGKLPDKNKKVKVTGVMTEPEKGRYMFKASKLE